MLLYFSHVHSQSLNILQCYLQHTFNTAKPLNINLEFMIYALWEGAGNKIYQGGNRRAEGEMLYKLNSYPCLVLVTTEFLDQRHLRFYNHFKVFFLYSLLVGNMNELDQMDYMNCEQ